MPYINFLAVPLLRIDEDQYTTSRFDLSDVDPKNFESAALLTRAERNVTEYLAAFNHFAFIKSGRKLLFGDFQGQHGQSSLL